MWTYHHGVVFAQGQSLYQNKATGMESPEMYSTSWCRNLTYLYGSENYPDSWGAGIGPRTEICINWGGPITMIPCLHQGNIYIQRKLQEWREQKCIQLVGGETPLTCAGLQTTPSHGRRYRSQNGSLRKLGWTYCHGTVLALRQFLYPKEAKGMERTEMYSTT